MTPLKLKFSFQCLLQVVVFACALPPIWGWGKEGHEMVGNLAYKLLSNETKAAIHEILAVAAPDVSHNKKHEDPNSSPLGDIADWADTVRHTSEYYWSGPLHYIDIHDNTVEGGCPVFHQTAEQQDKCHFDYARDCGEDFCVAGAIVNYTTYLSDWKQQQSAAVFPRHNRLRGSASLLMPWNTQHQHQNHQPLPSKLVQDSLKFLTHFVGDIHQPLHSARTTDRGGNSIDVEFDAGGSSFILLRDHHHLRHKAQHHKGWELHAVWDTGIIERALHLYYNGSRTALEAELLEYIKEANDTGDLVKWLQCPDTTQRRCPTQWAAESWQNALEWAYKNSDDDESEVVSGTHLTEEYFETRLAKIKHFLAVAGVRLAASLEIALGRGSSTSNSPNTALLLL